jgi:hypothetical protein
MSMVATRGPLTPPLSRREREMLVASLRDAAFNECLTPHPLSRRERGIKEAALRAAAEV